LLVSHLKKFIFLKTFKTASTSVEIYLERYCRSPHMAGVDEATFPRDEIVTAEGIIGARMPDPHGKTWFNHMPASRVRELLGESIWNDYFKCCVVRNPFDQVVSYWWFKYVPMMRVQMANATFTDVRHAFNAWLINTDDLPIDRHIYTIDGKTCVDMILKYEKLLADLKLLCERLEIPFEPNRLGTYKDKFRARREPFWLYFTEETQRKVEEYFEPELRTFGYGIEPENAG